MKLISTSTTFLSLSFMGKADAFAPSRSKPLARISITSLKSMVINHDEDAMHMMIKADKCAHSETCSVDDAAHYLDEVLHLQSDCISGSLTKDEICEDVAFPAAVVGSLREKIVNETSKSAFNPTPVFITLGAVYLIAGAYSMLHNPDVEMFSVQEWWWGIRDGYGGQMLSASLKHGGMLAVDGTANPVAASTAAAMPVTPIAPAVTVLPVAPVEDLYDPEEWSALYSSFDMF